MREGTVLVFACALVGASQIFAQAPPACRVLCTPEFMVEPTVTFSNVFGSPRIVDEQGATTRELRETAFEVILSLGLPTRVSWLEFTVEAIFLPFDRESTPELELETNVIWQDDDGVAVCPALDSVSEAEIDPVWEDAGAHPFDVRIWRHELTVVGHSDMVPALSRCASTPGTEG